MIRPLACLALFASIAGCDEAPACTEPAVPQRMVATTTTATRLITEWAGDHAYYVLNDADTPADLYVGPRCGEARLVARGATMRPARVGLDPDDDDPTLACLGGNFYRLDLTGELLPALVYPDRNCNTIPTAHGLLVEHDPATDPGLWLYSAFPDLASATRLDERGLEPAVRGEAVYFRDSMDQVVHVELTTGERMALASDVAAWRATETHLLWRNATTDDEPAQIVLLDVTTGTQHMLDLQASTDGSFAWQFEPGGEFVIHERRDVAVIEAFDLRGQPVPLPALGVLLSVFPGGGVLTRDADGQLFHTELRAQASVALDHRIDPMPPKPGPQFFRSPVASDRIEVLRGDDLWAVPLDGAEASLLARDVALPITWIDEGHLLTLFDGVLQTISVPGGERRVHARDVAAVTTAGKLSVDGAHYLREDGVWYLPPSALRGAPAPD